MKLVGFFVSLLATRGPRPTRKTGKEIIKTGDRLSIHNTRMKWAADTDAVVLIDLENVRGKSDFDLTHRELLKRTTMWAKMNDLQDKVTMVVDHGSLHTAYYLPDGGLSMVFAGPRMKADDVLARDVAFFGRNAIVITADNELMSRCRNAMANSDADLDIQFIQPIKFITDLKIMNDQVQKQHEEIVELKEQIAVNGDGNIDAAAAEANAALSAELAIKIDEEIKIRGAMYETETQMREKKNMNTPKKRRKLEKRARMLCERLALKGGQKIDHLTTLDGVSEYDRVFQGS
jgi:hypothetical protein